MIEQEIGYILNNEVNQPITRNPFQAILSPLWAIATQPFETEKHLN